MQLDTRLQSHDMLLRILAYGNAKTKKTWWAGKAAEAGFNVLLLDGDDGWHVLKNIAPAAQKRIQIVNMTDHLQTPIFSTALARLLKDEQLIWDEKERKSAKLQPNENCIHIDLRTMGRHSVLILDSWTALVRSLMLQYARENSIDLTNADEDEDKWGYYRWAGNFALWAMQMLTSLHCHIIVIAHVDVYEKRKKQGKKMVVEWQKRQIKSTSGPNAMQMPSQFSDILYFYIKGSAWKISTRGNEEAEGGSRIMVPAEHNWDDLQFTDIINAAGLPLPPADNPHLNYSLPNQAPKVTNPGLVQAVPTQPATLKVGGAKTNKLQF